MVARSGTMPGAGGQGSAAQVPWGWLGYAEVVTSQAGITTVTDLTGLSQAVTVGTSRRVKVTVDTYPASTVAGDIVTLKIMEGATELTRRSLFLDSAGVNGALQCVVVLTPSAGAHTYKATLERASGTGSISNGAAATYPSFIFPEDVGPAS